jgi:hypothetical protein
VTTSRLSRAAVPAVAVLIAACSDTSSYHGGPLVWDSAGIAIVDNRHSYPAWGGGGWTLTERPIVQIGAVDSDGPEELYGVTHSRLFPNGDILVVNSRTQEIRIFDEAGRYRTRIGRRGDGPGEFRSPWHAYPGPADSIIVVDLYRSVSVFDDLGTYVRSFVPGGTRGEGQGAPVGQFENGSVLLKRYQPSDPTWTGIVRNQVELVRVDLDGHIVTSFGIFDEQTGRFGGGPQHLFGARAAFAVGANSLYYAPGDQFELREIGQDGQTVRLIRLDVPRRPVTPAEKEAFVANALERAREEGREAAWERLFAGADAASHFPAHSDIQVASGGYLWVEDYQPMHVRLPRRWYVFDPEGTYMGHLTVPAQFRIHQITGDRVIGRWTDEYGVEFIRVYGIEKRSPTNR